MDGYGDSALLDAIRTSEAANQRSDLAATQRLQKIAHFPLAMAALSLRILILAPPTELYIALKRERKASLTRRGSGIPLSQSCRRPSSSGFTSLIADTLTTALRCTLQNVSGSS